MEDGISVIYAAFINIHVFDLNHFDRMQKLEFWLK